ncbi:MAG: proprotein convertase P-domain-containing protein, partial [Flavobacteriales bacterium]|nr:proprotein convertase P-domain-containing protein [Flavobacteriales bacterium]
QYGAVTNLNAATSQQPQVGLRGPNNTFATQVKNLLVGSGAETWAAPLPGTANTSTMRFTSTAPAKSPAANQAFSFSPGCISPTATTTVTSNCAGNSFSVTVSITSLGSATAANITASPGGTLHSSVGVGSYVCGPFTLGTPVTLNVVHSTNSACTNVLGIFNPTPTCTTLTNGDCILDPPYPAIPDNGCSTGSVLQATIPISGVNTTLGFLPGQTFFQSLELIIAHTYRGDLQVRLTSPSGQTRDMLINAPTAQAAGSNFGNPGSCPAVVLQLRDAGGQPLSAMDPNLNNISGIFTPEQSLSGFTGNPNGNWILSICDGGLEDAGSLRFARLRLLNVDCAGVPGGTTLPGSACNDGNPNTTGDVYNASCVCAGTPASGVNVAVKVLLDGPLNTTTGVMADGLRSPLRIPTTEPYTALGFTQVGGGGETVNTSVFNVTGNDAIVDWVLVELRNSANNTQVVRTRCGLLQRDGDVVDVNGTSPLSFPVAAGSYFVAVRHRNHLGVMTSTARSLTSTALSIDFSTAATAVFGTNARKTVGAFQSLWSGNTVRDGQLGYTGPGNDRDPILLRVGSTSPNNTTTGYFVEDVNMDATVKYIGADNDRDPILVNVGNTTPNNVRIEQLP